MQSGKCDLAVGNTYYMAVVMTNEKNPEQWAAAVKLIWAHVDAVLQRQSDGRLFEAATFDGWIYARYLDIYECP